MVRYGSIASAAISAWISLETESVARLPAPDAFDPDQRQGVGAPFDQAPPHRVVEYHSHHVADVAFVLGARSNTQSR